MEKKKSKQIVLSILGILSLVLITAGVTVAVFTYTKLGETENTITVGTIKFLYTENTGVGKGIQITNAMPVADSVGMAYDTEGYVFDFSITGENSGTEAIPYEVTLRQKADSTLANNIVKVYLTDMTGDADTEIVAPTLYSALTQTTVDVGDNIEKTLTSGTVDGGVMNYAKDFRLRMWIDEDADFSAIDHYKDTAGNVITEFDYAALDTTAQAGYSIVTHINTSDNTMYTQAEYDVLEDKTNVETIANAPVYPYNGKSFTALVNVYSNVPTVTTEG